MRIKYYVNANSFLHGKNSFAEIFKNLATYRSENNFIRS